MKQYDAIIIGYGKAGKTLAIELAKQKWSVALIEQSENKYGDSCTSASCMPISRLIEEAQVADLITQNNFEAQANFYKQAIMRKKELTQLIYLKNKTDLTNFPQITLYRGTASFTSNNSIQITSDENIEELNGKEIFINTGLTEVIPAIDGLAQCNCIYTPEALLQQEVLPKHLIIISNGNEGFEYASLYADFGSKVTLIESDALFMSYADRDIAGCVQNVFEKKGIEIHLNTLIESVNNKEGNVELNFISKSDNNSHTIVGDALLIAINRKPMIKALNLSLAGVATDESGAIITNNHLHTTLPNIWAMGSVRRNAPFIYNAIDDCKIILNKLFGDETRSTEDRYPVPYSINIDPPFAHVGITETEAIEKNYPFKVSRIIVSDTTGDYVLRKTEGMMKAIINTDTQRIIGCTLFCNQANEIINCVNMAMKCEQPYTYLRDFIFSHPSYSEKLNLLFALE